ncbi:MULTISPECIES: hypothetical protein [Burkholderia]|uniref:hypothetical protein n=1 Tax=Burkholderia TaxID=32008 RepID=UPI00084C3FAF|nr:MULTISPECIES: hypothetical protein [Burkholderia]MBR8403382.1 hypothetical protein [Burkholderia cenocepacia]OED14457.1 hypothetical protein A9Z05_16960 [Burkholderia sp. A2]OXI67581.1 hypothetical protein CFB81_23340 [Burkholderia sp. AU28863]
MSYFKAPVAMTGAVFLRRPDRSEPVTDAGRNHGPTIIAQCGQVEDSRVAEHRAPMHEFLFTLRMPIR